ncbi:hypothetical protein HMPREF1633_03520 [Tissierellia bacterium S5-A11]|nr:hypothetical protein HMPREF1633_03520 [Tissierellia bacterium S5-A11]
MELLHLQYFSEVAHWKSFTRASQSLHISQPSISKAIRALEERWGVQLFHRQGKTIALTDAGEVILPKVEEFLDQYYRMEADIVSPELRRQGKIVLGVAPMVGTIYLPELLRDFAAAYPYLAIELVERPTAVVEELLESGAVHCGFCIVPTINGDHETLLLPREEVHAFLHKDHPLAAKDALTIEDLATTKLITFTNETTLYRSIIRNFQAREMRPQIAIQAYEWSLLAAFADANVGVTLLPEPLGRFVPQLYPNLVDRPLVDTDLAWRAALVWQDKRYAGTVVELFVEFFRMHQGLDTAASAAHKK